MRTHYQVGGGIQPRPWDDQSAPWLTEGGGVDQGLRDVYEVNAPLILEQHRPGPILSVYNFPIGNDVTVEQLVGHVDTIYGEEQYAFRLNLSFGVILRNRETGHFRYFKPYTNQAVLETPFAISKRGDLKRLRLQLSKLDLVTELLRTRPDTKWVPVLITNVRFYAYSTNYPIG